VHGQFGEGRVMSPFFLSVFFLVAMIASLALMGIWEGTLELVSVPAKSLLAYPDEFIVFRQLHLGSYL